MRARRSEPSSPRRRASSSASSTGRRRARRRRSSRRRPRCWRLDQPLCAPSLAAAEPVDVVREPDEHQHQEERDPDRRDALVDLPADRLPRIPSMIEKRMWPPSSGSSGRRFRSARERLIRPSTWRYHVKLTDTTCCDTSTMPTGPETSLRPEPVTIRGKNVIVAFAARQLSPRLCGDRPARAVADGCPPVLEAECVVVADLLRAHRAEHHRLAVTQDGDRDGLSLRSRGSSSETASTFGVG